MKHITGVKVTDTLLLPLTNSLTTPYLADTHIFLLITYHFFCGETEEEESMMGKKKAHGLR